MRNFVLVGLGGAAGSMLRYGVHLWMKRLEFSFPLATFIVNMTGCLLIGFLFGLSAKTPWLQGAGWLVLGTGFCGGFTTYSAFALENSELLEKQWNGMAVLYAGLSVILGILLCRTAVWLVK